MHDATKNTDLENKLPNSSSDDDDNSEEEEFLLAKKILSHRPTCSAVPIIPKGGLKFSANCGTDEEQLQLQSYYRARKDLFSSLKVRKLGTLGLAEWLPDLSVAKVIRRGKFVQVQGFPHEDDFLALRPEEALFLLDVGDIELSYKGALLSLQDAFFLLLSPKRGQTTCTIDDYCVYAHLRRMGYRVQRYFDVEDARGNCSEEEMQVSGKRERRDDPSVSTRSKKVKVFNESENSGQNSTSNVVSAAANHTPTTAADNLTTDDELNIDTQSCGEVHVDALSSLHRGWWTGSVRSSSQDESSMRKTETFLPSAVKFLNLANHCEVPAVINELPSSLLPPNVCSWAWQVEDVWYQRLKKSNDPNPSLVFSHPQRIDFADVNRRAKNWSDYKNLVQMSIKEKQVEMQNLCDVMHGGEVKPLVHPRSADSLKSVLDQVRFFKGRTSPVEKIAPSNDAFKIQFNVFQTDPEKPFKKSNPGKPLVRVCVLNPEDPVPTLADTKTLSEVSGGVPVKIALVNNGRVMFFGFDDIDIPIELMVS